METISAKMIRSIVDRDVRDRVLYLIPKMVESIDKFLFCLFLLIVQNVLTMTVQQKRLSHKSSRAFKNLETPCVLKSEKWFGPRLMATCATEYCTWSLKWWRVLINFSFVFFFQSCKMCLTMTVQQKRLSHESSCAF